MVGDKGIFSTAEDLFLFDRALYCEAFLNEENLTLAFTPAQPFDEKHQQDYGLGFRVKQECNGQKIAYHHGWWKGFRTYFIHDYANHRTLIWLNNRSDVTINPYIEKIFEIAGSFNGGSAGDAYAGDDRPERELNEPGETYGSNE